MKVWVVTITHDSGYNTHAAATEELAKKIVQEYAKEWWAQEIEDPQPEDPDELVDTYFETTLEDYSIDEVDVRSE